MRFILGTKLGMTQMFNGKGNVIPVTLINAGPCQITQIKTKEKDGYEAVQISFGKKKKEFRNKTLEIKNFELGSEINVNEFKEGDIVKISGISKGKGFQGGVKRWGFHGRNRTHGVKHEHRTIGSVGCSFPQRVIKGRKMPGRTGGERKTIKNLKIVKIDFENNLIAVCGAIPGKKNTILEIRSEKK